MPRIYKRKEGVTPRIPTWTEESIRKAAKAVESNTMRLKAAAKAFGIPPRTLGRRIKKADFTINGLGKGPVLGFENEKKLANLVETLEKIGFPCSRKDIRRMAYQLATKLNIKHNFDDNSKMAGKQWVQSFLERNKHLSIKKNERISLDRVLEINNPEIKEFSDLLAMIFEESDLYDRRDRLFTTNDDDETQKNDEIEEIVCEVDNPFDEETSSSKEET